MIQKVLKVGTSVALVVPKDVAQEMGFKVGDTVTLKADPARGSVTYRKVTPTKGREAKIADLTLNFVSRYRKDLEALKNK